MLLRNYISRELAFLVHSLRPEFQLLIKKCSARVSPIIRSSEELTNLIMDPVYLTSEEVIALQKYAKSAKHILEIGSAYGASTTALLSATKAHASLYSLDPFVQDSMGEFQANAKRCQRNVKRALIALGISHNYSSWHLISDYSYNVVKAWNNPIDLLFIDGDHRYKAVKKDFIDWIKHVNQGGHIFIHDSRMLSKIKKGQDTRGWPGPSKLAKELLNHYCVTQVGSAFSLTIWRKNKSSCQLCKKAKQNL